MDCSLPDSSIDGILQARILEWVAIPFSRGSSYPETEARSPALQAILYHLSHQGSPGGFLYFLHLSLNFAINKELMI